MLLLPGLRNTGRFITITYGERSAHRVTAAHISHSHWDYMQNVSSFRRRYNYLKVRI